MPDNFGYNKPFTEAKLFLKVTSKAASQCTNDIEIVRVAAYFKSI